MRIYFWVCVYRLRLQVLEVCIRRSFCIHTGRAPFFGTPQIVQPARGAGLKV